MTEEPLRYTEVGPTRFAWRRLGAGPPLLFIHGWPFTSATWRRVVQRLAEHFTCYLPDTPGLGLTEWSDTTPLDLAGQARTFAAFLDALGIQRAAVIAHDTGATIARVLAADEPERVERLVIMNTETPGHRPPWLPAFQRAMALPGSSAVFRWLLRSPTFLRSGAGFGGCFSDPALLDEAFVERYVSPVLADRRRLDGLSRYLRAVDWKLVDALSEVHARIRAPSLIVWGAEDKTFPVAGAHRIAAELPACEGACEVAGAALLVQEERPEEVLAAVLPFLRKG